MADAGMPPPGMPVSRDRPHSFEMVDEAEDFKAAIASAMARQPPVVGKARALADPDLGRIGGVAAPALPGYAKVVEERRRRFEVDESDEFRGAIHGIYGDDASYTTTTTNTTDEPESLDDSIGADSDADGESDEDEDVLAALQEKQVRVLDGGGGGMKRSARSWSGDLNMAETLAPHSLICQRMAAPLNGVGLQRRVRSLSWGESAPGIVRPLERPGTCAWADEPASPEPDADAHDSETHEAGASALAPCYVETDETEDFMAAVRAIYEETETDEAEGQEAGLARPTTLEPAKAMPAVGLTAPLQSASSTSMASRSSSRSMVKVGSTGDVRLSLAKRARAAWGLSASEVESARKIYGDNCLPAKLPDLPVDTFRGIAYICAFRVPAYTIGALAAASLGHHAWAAAVVGRGARAVPGTVLVSAAALGVSSFVAGSARFLEQYISAFDRLREHVQLAQYALGRVRAPVSKSGSRGEGRSSDSLFEEELALVTRDGSQRWVQCSTLVPGDIVHLEEGRVPADCNLLTVNGLKVTCPIAKLPINDSAPALFSTLWWLNDLRLFSLLTKPRERGKQLPNAETAYPKVGEEAGDSALATSIIKAGKATAIVTRTGKEWCAYVLLAKLSSMSLLQVLMLYPLGGVPHHPTRGRWRL